MCGMVAGVGQTTAYPTCWNFTSAGGDHPVPDYAKANFETELLSIIKQHLSFPSIIAYQVFNEAWGEYPTAAVAIGVAKYCSCRHSE